MKKTIGIIGFGNMGSSIVGNLKPQGDKYEIWVFDKDKNKIISLSGVNIAENNIDLVSKVDTVILAIKPQEFSGVLIEIKNNVKEKLIISIAAGITTEHIERRLGGARVMRAMPNMPARVGAGVTCLCKGRFASENDFYLAQRLFYCLGKTLKIEEKMMNMATVISGSGPAYFYDFIESQRIDYRNISEQIKRNFIDSLEKAAESLGFNIAEAAFLAATTINGSEALLKKTNLSPGELKEQITSKGGVTSTALDVLHKGGSLEEAVRQALRRAEELSKQGV